MSPQSNGETKRRDFLRIVGSTGIVGSSTVLAGCSSGSSSTSGSTSDGSGTQKSNKNETQTTHNKSNPDKIQKGGSITVAATSAADTLQIHKLADTTGANVGHNISNTLLRVDADGKIIPDLAREMPQISESGKKYTFKLRKGVKFHKPYDQKMTADDVVWNFRKILEEDYGGFARAGFVGILVGNDAQGNSLDPAKTVRKTGKYEMEFHLSTPLASFPYKIAKYTAGIIPKKSLKDHGKKLGNPNVGSWGTGPFMFKNAVSGESYTLKRNPDYFKKGDAGQLPYLDEITFQIVPKASVRQTGLKAGKIDVDESVGATDVKSLKNSKRVTLKSRPSSQRLSMWVNQRNWEPMMKKKTRKALAYGMNKKALIQTKFKGGASPSLSIFPPWHWAYNEDAVVKYPHDPEKAKSLLKEAGESSLKFNCTPENIPMFVDTATIIQQNYSQIDVDMEVTPKSYAAAWDPIEDGWGDKSVPPQSWNAMIGAYAWGFSADDYAYATFHKGGWNYSYYNNKKVNKWTEEARSTVKRAKRKKLYDKVAHQVTDDMPKILMIWPNYNLGLNKSLHNVPIYPDATFFFSETWKENK